MPIEEILSIVLSVPAVREILEDVLVKAFAEVVKLKSLKDPVYASKATAVFTQVANCKTDEDRVHASTALFDLMH